MPRERGSLSGRVLAIAGASGTLGPIVVRRLAERGASLALGARDREPLVELAKSVGIEADTAAVDLLAAADARSMGERDRRSAGSRRRSRPPRRRVAGGHADRGGATGGLGLPSGLARPHRPACDPGVRAPPDRDWSRPLRDRLEQPGSDADAHECGLCGGEGSRRGVDARPRASLSRHRSDRERHRRRARSSRPRCARSRRTRTSPPSRPPRRSPRPSPTCARMPRRP